MTPLLGDEANRGWNYLMNDVSNIFKDKSIDDIKKPVNQTNTNSIEKKRHTILELFVVSIITAIGLSIGYRIFDFLSGLI